MYGMKDQKIIDAILDLYREGATIREVAEAVHMSTVTVGDIIRERGLTRKRGNRSPAKMATFSRTCPACGNTKHLVGATYCMDCGSVLASPKELAADAADRVMKFLEKYGKVVDVHCAVRDMSIVTSYLRGGGV